MKIGSRDRMAVDRQKANLLKKCESNEHPVHSNGIRHFFPSAKYDSSGSGK
jgi:hypothetical protein